METKTSQFAEKMPDSAVLIGTGGMNELSRAAEKAAANSAGMKLFARQWLDEAQAEDVVQEALVALLSLKQAPNDALGWMYATVRNAAIDLARAGSRRRKREERVARTEWFVAQSESPLDVVTAQQALEGLPRELREIVVLRIWGELGYEQIARIAQVSVGTAHQRFAEAMRELRIQLNV
jgi:RNA polymerase sigma factor (sigma-70 family)